METETNPSGPHAAQDLSRLAEEMRELKRCFDTWASQSSHRRSGPIALKLVEDPVREFFGRVSPHGVRVGAGERPALDPRYASDMDIVFDYDGDAWVAHLRMAQACARTRLAAGCLPLR